MGRDGLPLDADNDGIPGGVLQADFRTLPLTYIPGTRVFGKVYDSYNLDLDGENIPVVGATISLDANPAVFAVTDDDGMFELGLQDLNNDGTADGLPAPSSSSTLMAARPSMLRMEPATPPWESRFTASPANALNWK